MEEVTRLVSTGDTVKIWDAVSMAPLEQFNPHSISEPVAQACWSSNSILISACGWIIASLKHNKEFLLLFILICGAFCVHLVIRCGSVQLHFQWIGVDVFRFVELLKGKTILSSSCRPVLGECKQLWRQAGGLQPQGDSCSSGGTGWWGESVPTSAVVCTARHVCLDTHTYQKFVMSELGDLLPVNVRELQMRALCNLRFRKGKPVCVWAPPLSFWSVGVLTTAFTSGTWRPRDCTVHSRCEFTEKRTVDTIFKAPQGCIMGNDEYRTSLTIWTPPLSVRTTKKMWPVCLLMPTTAPSPPARPAEIWSSTVWPPMCPAKPSVTAPTRWDWLLLVKQRVKISS